MKRHRKSTDPRPSRSSKLYKVSAIRKEQLDIKQLARTLVDVEQDQAKRRIKLGHHLGNRATSQASGSLQT